MINFGTLIDFTQDYYNSDGLSDFIQQELENYFCQGLPPGGFTTAVLAGDLFSAAMKADYWNKPNIAKIANWISNNAPSGSYGSPEHVKNWIADKDKCRSTYVTYVEQKAMWAILQA